MSKVLKHYTKELTPLKFHKFYHYVLTPLNILNIIYMIASMFANRQFSTLALIYDLLLLVSCILTFVGCFDFKAYAWWAIIGGFALEIFYDLYTVIYYAVAFPQFTIDAISQVGWRVAMIIVFGIYYYKRKPLFFDPVPLEEIPKEYRKPVGKKKSK